MADHAVGTAIASYIAKMLIQVLTSPVERLAKSDLTAIEAVDAVETASRGETRASDAPLGTPFNRAASTPLYSQIREALRERISDGTYRSDGRLPSENELVKAYGVSRITVRQALNDLQKEGLIFKVHGKGTFVSRPKAVQSLMRLEGFGEAMSAAGHETHSRILGHRVTRASQHIASRLRLAESTEVMEIRRVRFLNSDPISLDVTYVPVEIGKRLIKEDLAHRDVFAILDGDYGIALDRAEMRIDAITADAVLAQLLAVELGAAVVRIERLTFSTNDKPIDFEYLYYRGDSFQYFVRVGRRRDGYGMPPPQRK